MSQDRHRGARPLRVLEDVRAGLVGTCRDALLRTVMPHAHLVVERHRGELKLDIPSREFSPLDRPFLALDAFATCRVATVFSEMGLPAGGPNSFHVHTAKVMGPIRIIHEELKGNMFELIRHLLSVDMEAKMGAYSDSIRAATYEIRTLLAADPA